MLRPLTWWEVKDSGRFLPAACDSHLWEGRWPPPGFCKPAQAEGELVFASLPITAVLQREGLAKSDQPPGIQGGSRAAMEEDNQLRVSFSVTLHPHTQPPDAQGPIYLWVTWSACLCPHPLSLPAPCSSSRSGAGIKEQQAVEGSQERAKSFRLASFRREGSSVPCSPKPGPWQAFLSADVSSDDVATGTSKLLLLPFLRTSRVCFGK